MTTINPYLTFNGTCEKAFKFYESIFGGEIPYMGYFKDMPENPEFPVSEADKQKVMHVSLPISKETVLMGSDSSEAFGHATVEGNNFSISVNTESVEEADRIFNALVEGGIAKMPVEKTFWGAYFGMLTDQFGIHWMVNCELEEHKEFEKENQQAANN